MVIVDTTVWVDYLQGKATPQVEWLEVEMAHQQLGLVDTTLYEVLQGVQYDRHVEEVRAALLQFAVFTTGGIDLATAAARNLQLLRAAGHPMQRIVVGLIATFCLLHNHTLLHNTTDFDPFEQVLGLGVIKV